ncbi:uncharacterized protein A1O9_05255 [Exophiala aquamarina CBS 119918]|uniref:Uncharacterized protein n=1 Tax=Exophiala aquamarina CBS 119918 TaxID=1182545 RepID=A0A072PDI2_9EURO|nr:uncharacterized protein A1O9_05255 [Exophiala aquamarina CBS 119918]KEF57338.1 hypothetical protein A1O9_05255 [Exophiala aquamarina CBS 119918]
MWPSKGSKKFSLAVAHHVLPLLEATPDDPLDPQAEQKDVFMGVVAEPSRPRPRNDRKPPSRRFMPRSFRKAILGGYAPRSESSPSQSRARKVIPRDQRSTELLEQELQLVAHRQPHPDPIRNILTMLIKQRQVKIAPPHYEASILANCHPKLGSIESVKSIVREIFREEVPMIPALTFAIVKVLSVHPDSLFRAYITDLMESQWISIPPAVAQLIVVAMIREGQIELARAEIGKMHEKGTAISDWVWCILIHALCDRGDCEAILDLCYTLDDQHFSIPRPTLLHVLDHASSIKDLDLTKHLWHTYVESMHIIPDEALSMAVLRVAAHHSDQKLAESVALVLGSGTTSTLPSPLEESSILASNGVLDASSVEPPVHRAAEHDTLHALPNGSEASEVSLNKTHIDDGAVSTLDGHLEAGNAILEKNARVDKGPSPSISTKGTAEPVKSGITADHIQPPLRTISAEAKSLLAWVRSSRNGRSVYRRNRRVGNLFPVFREDMGLRDARFDPMLALRRRQGCGYGPLQRPRRRG